MSKSPRILSSRRWDKLLQSRGRVIQGRRETRLALPSLNCWWGIKLSIKIIFRVQGSRRLHIFSISNSSPLIRNRYILRISELSLLDHTQGTALAANPAGLLPHKPRNPHLKLPSAYRVKGAIEPFDRVSIYMHAWKLAPCEKSLGRGG